MISETEPRRANRSPSRDRVPSLVSRLVSARLGLLGNHYVSHKVRAVSYSGTEMGVTMYHTKCARCHNLGLKWVLQPSNTNKQCTLYPEPSPLEKRCPRPFHHWSRHSWGTSVPKSGRPASLSDSTANSSTIVKPAPGEHFMGSL
jgi:hypothetical protein